MFAARDGERVVYAKFAYTTFWEIDGNRWGRFLRYAVVDFDIILTVRTGTLLAS